MNEPGNRTVVVDITIFQLSIANDNGTLVNYTLGINVSCFGVINFSYIEMQRHSCFLPKLGSDSSRLQTVLFHCAAKFL
jgi:hypothetical protein